MHTQRRDIDALLQRNTRSRSFRFNLSSPQPHLGRAVRPLDQLHGDLASRLERLCDGPQESRRQGGLCRDRHDDRAAKLARVRGEQRVQGRLAGDNVCARGFRNAGEGRSREAGLRGGDQQVRRWRQRRRRRHGAAATTTFSRRLGRGGGRWAICLVYGDVYAWCVCEC